MVKQKKSLPIPEKHKIVANLIRVGKPNALLLQDIMTVAGIQDKRLAYQIIEELIVKYGYVIVASRTGEHKGYYKPANEKELVEAARTFKNSIDTMKKRHTALLNNYKKGVV